MARQSPRHETALNVELAKEIQALGLDAHDEDRYGTKRHDVHVIVDNVPVVLEAEIDSKRGAIIDADRRLAQGQTSLVFAISYEAGTQSIDKNTKMIWTLRSRDVSSSKAREGAPAVAQWSPPGTVRELAEDVRLAPGLIDNADMAAGLLLVALEQAAQAIPPDSRRALANELNLPEPKGDKPSERDPDYLKRTKRAMLVLATSILFQHRLGHIPGWRDPDICAMDAEPVTAFRTVWRFILDVDYQPIFETAQLALAALPNTVDANRVVSELALAVGRVARHTTGMRHDLLGRVFHRVLDTARYDGSFYTSTAAATLLAALALPRALKPRWTHDVIDAMRVCDPACGTGTLLMAAAERLNQLKRGDTELDAELDDLLAASLVEHVIYGYDTNLTATHMTASTLGMLHPQAWFDQIHVNQTPFGVYDDPDGGGKKVARVGALEFLQVDGMLLQPWPSARSVDGNEWRREPPPPMDLVIMNPPFTRDSLRHDQLGADAEALMKEREKQLLAGKEYRSAARLHSSSGMFNVLATKMLNQDEGTLAMILPTVVATSPGNQALREFLSGQLHIDTVVSSHDPQRIFFSENTNIGELLIICRRWDGEGEKPATRFVNLARNPRTPYEASDLARTLDTGGDGEFTVRRVDAGSVGSGDWLAVNFYAPWLGSAYGEVAANLVRLDAIAEVGPAGQGVRGVFRKMAAGLLVRLDAIADIGPTGRRIRDTYRKFDQPTDSGRRALWHHKTDVVTSMRAETDVYIEPIKGKEHLAERYWEQRSRLLLPARVRLNTARVSAAIVDEPVIGSLWVPCRPRDDGDAMEGAICAWFNSSPGILAMYGGRDSHTLSRPAYSLDTQRSLPVPDFPALPEARDALAAAYEEMKDQPLRPLPEMARDPVRMRLDDIVGDALGFEREWVARIRKALGEEPSITNRPLYADAEAKQAGLL